ncbi:MAG TPA: 4Fe-4S binding protein [Clostridiales bacterium]|nr:4Fe-4S binding protein [Clostridiales bacterium]
MKYRKLGNTGISVSRICFGSLTIGPLQRNLPFDEGCRVLSKAVEMGINFIDTADLYETYPFINYVIKSKPDLIVATKSYAYNTETAEQTLNRALKGTGRDYIDIFLLHEQEGPLTLKGHEEALQFYIRQKEKGIIRAVGISTHYVAAVKTAARMKEIDVIHPILNYRGVGIVDGSREEMEQAIAEAWNAGKGIYIMKSLGGGHLIGEYEKALNYIVDFPHAHSVAIGMQREEEVEANVMYFSNKYIPEQLTRKLQQYERKLIIEYWCQGCGKCILRCGQRALYLQNGKAEVDTDKCILCGYCGSVCKELAIKVI